MTFDTVATATAALYALEGRTIQNRPITARYSKNRSTRPTSTPSRAVFIGGLPHDVTEETVRNSIFGFEGLKEFTLSMCF